MNQKFLLSTVTLILCLACSAAAQKESGSAKELPSPSGSFGVSRIGYDWVDTSRHDTASGDPSIHREIMVYVWYPAKRMVTKNRAPYLPGADLIAKRSDIGDMKDFWGEAWPSIVGSHIISKICEQTEAAQAAAKFPLLVSSPGLGISSTSYTVMIQELVSRGYIVASVEPTYEVAAVAFPDGRAVVERPEATGRLPSPPGDTRRNS